MRQATLGAMSHASSWLPPCAGAGDRAPPTSRPPSHRREKKYMVKLEVRGISFGWYSYATRASSPRCPLAAHRRRAHPSSRLRRRPRLGVWLRLGRRQRRPLAAAFQQTAQTYPRVRRRLRACRRHARREGRSGILPSRSCVGRAADSPDPRRRAPKVEQCKWFPGKPEFAHEAKGRSASLPELSKSKSSMCGCDASRNGA